LCTSSCRYSVIKKAARDLGFKCVQEENCDWDIYWSDTGLPLEKVSRMKPYQRINHFPAMVQLGKKTFLAKNI